MGDTMTKPITDKHSTILENELLTVGATGMQVCLEGSSGEGMGWGGRDVTQHHITTSQHNTGMEKGDGGCTCYHLET